VERKRGKEEVESWIVDLEKLMLYFAKF